jgi:hypothetical protein
MWDSTPASTLDACDVMASQQQHHQVDELLSSIWQAMEDHHMSFYCGKAANAGKANHTT